MALYAFDGTWNHPDYNSEDGKDTNTNVFHFVKHYKECLDNGNRPLTAEYISGIGTRHGLLGKSVGGLLGAGGHRRVQEMLERYIANHAAGDGVIDIVGFSRGAALALDFANQLIDGVKINGVKIRAESIRFLGLWDTVPAFGIPGAMIDVANDINIGWELDLPPSVQLCAHALARHERRQAFDIHRLDPKHKHSHVKEIWFRGVHSDIGGGNGNTPLNAIALRWMMEQGRSIGIPFSDEQLLVVQSREDANATYSKNRDVGEEIDRIFYEKDSLHPSSAKFLAIGETKTVSVDSRNVFDFAGIIVENGASYIFIPDTSGRWFDKKIECTAGGWPENLSRNGNLWKKVKEGMLESRMAGYLRRVRAANWFEVCACPGFDDDNAIPIGKNQHRDTPWHCKATAPLTFFANDTLFPINQYHNNDGVLQITVKRIS